MTDADLIARKWTRQSSWWSRPPLPLQTRESAEAIEALADERVREFAEDVAEHFRKCADAPLIPPQCACRLRDAAEYVLSSLPEPLP